MRAMASIAVAIVVVMVAMLDMATAGAEPIRAASHERIERAEDGRVMVVGHRNESHSPPVHIGLTREMIVNNSAYGSLSQTRGAALTEATLTAGYHVGCAFDLTTVIAALGGTAGLLQDQSTVTVRPKADGPPELGDSNIYPNVNIQPQASATLRPGTVIDLPIATASFKNFRAGVDLVGARITVEGCIGPVTVRSYVSITTKTAVADETVVVYGDPIAM